MALADEIKAVVEKLPELDEKAEDKKKRRRGEEGKLTGPPWDEAGELYDAVLAKGRPGVEAVIDMIRPPDEGGDYKARYMLAGLGVYACREGKDKARRAVVGALAAKLPDVPSPIRATLAQELQRVGTDAAAAALSEMLTDEKLCDPAARALLAIGAGAKPFRDALAKAKGPARLHLVQSIAAAADPTAAGVLREALDDGNRDVRLAAARGLADLAHADSADDLLKLAGTKDRWQRIQATKACLVLAENLAAAGKADDAKRVYRQLRDTRTEPDEQYVKEAAERALAGA